MKLKKCAIAAIACTILLTPISPIASALPRGAFDPRDLHSQVAGERTEVLVLATPHLSQTPAGFDPAVLTDLLQKLESFAPDVVAIENLSGESLSSLEAYRLVYPGVAEGFGATALKLAATARAHIGLDLPEAEAGVRAALAELGPNPTAAQRRRLALLFLASGDPNSAVVQWWQLTPEEQAAEDFPKAVRMQLEAFGATKNESALIGARLAARLGLNRVHPIDDQSAVDLLFPVAEELGAAISADPGIAKGLGSAKFLRISKANERLVDQVSTLGTYREINTPSAGLVDTQAQWLIMIDRIYPHSAGRVRMGEWEARNLRIAANIREAAATVPNGRVLVIIGASHKPWLDAYLNMMSDMHVVDAGKVLR